MADETEKMGIRELRDNLTATIRRVRAGATIEITHQRVPVARLTPVHRDRLAELIEAGEVTPAERPFELPRRTFPSTTGVTATEALEEDRAER
jgi:antitoxin (DNA-binding transcriptional repressor) of toxin-antitoxin stability system